MSALLYRRKPKAAVSLQKKPKSEGPAAPSTWTLGVTQLVICKEVREPLCVPKALELIQCVLTCCVILHI